MDHPRQGQILDRVMNPPSPEDQLKFLANLQRLLAEGQFVATYKYSLLLALADLAVELGDDSGSSLEIPTWRIAEQFIHNYWRQCIPYETAGSGTGKGQILQQNAGRQAAVLTLIGQLHQRYDGSLFALKRDSRQWRQLVGQVDRVVRIMPLWKLQTVGGGRLDFLYENIGQGKMITLHPGVACCLRKFYGLVTDLVRGAWVRYIRQHNSVFLGSAVDLHEFLFGTERAALSVVMPILQEFQKGECFYCHGTLRDGSAHVDHFIPWSRYPVDLGHNFVLAHNSCNEAKSDRLADVEHLSRWAKRNQEDGGALAKEFDLNKVVYDVGTTNRIAFWAYSQAQVVGGLTWRMRNVLVPLAHNWEPVLTGSA